MNLTIGRKIIVTFALIAAIVLIFGVVNLSSTETVLNYLSLRNQSFVMQFQAAKVLAEVTEAESGQRGFIITGIDGYLIRYSKAQSDASDAIKEMRKLSETDAQRSVQLDDLQTHIDNKFKEMDRCIALRRSDGFDAASTEVRTGEGQREMDQIRTVAGRIQEVESEHLKTLMDTSIKSRKTLYNIITVGTIGALIVLLFIGVVLARNISLPLAEMTLASQRIASGELNTNFRTDRRSDEVGMLRTAFARMNRVLAEMAAVARRIASGDLSGEIKPQSERDQLGEAFCEMQRNLRDLMKQTHETVGVLTSAASGITASITQVAASSEQTVAAISETTATVEQVKKTAELNSDKVRQVSENAQRAAQTSDQGKSAVEWTTAGMNRIRQQMDAIAATMVRLSEQTLAIGEIIASVNDLAEQSNILAVNASIEAAKAGEHGKGFAIVAQEVRSLAEQSKQATTQVRTMLNEIQKATSAAMMATEQGSKAVDAGIQQSEQAGHSISTLAEGISKSAQAAIQIAASSQQQAVGMDQVTVAMRNIQEASVQNTAAVRQVQDSARLLSEIGRKLKVLVERYKI